MRLLRLVILVAAVAIVVFPAGRALAYPPANPVRTLPATVEKGATFNVTVNFTAPADNFTAISLTDFAPDSWNVTVNGAWCQPAATANTTGNKSEFVWYLTPYPNGTHFTVLYKVTVPCSTELGNYTFGNGFLGYYIGNITPHIFENISGDYNITVVPPAIRNTTSIKFYASVGQNPENETLQIWSSTPCMLNWSLSDDADWLSEYPTSGNCTNVASSVALSVNSSGMSLGNYTANITIESPDANNSPQIVPVSLHISLTGTLEGHISFCRNEDPGGPTWETPIVVRFFVNSTKLEAGFSPVNITTDAYGNFTIQNIAVGTYDIGIKNCTCLSKMVFGKVMTAGNSTSANFGTSREGDINGDDWVQAKDRGLLYLGWGTQNVVQGGYLCDLNRDGWLQAKDRGLMYQNWGQSGDLVPYLS